MNRDGDVKEVFNMTVFVSALLCATINPITMVDHALCHSVSKISKRENIIFIEQETPFIWITLCIDILFFNLVLFQDHMISLKMSQQKISLNVF